MPTIAMLELNGGTVDLLGIRLADTVHVAVSELGVALHVPPVRIEPKIVHTEKIPSPRRETKIAPTVASSGGLRPNTETPPAKKRLPATSVAEAGQFQWQENDCKNSYCAYPAAYRFVLRNKTEYRLSYIKYVLIFYGPNGVPVHSVEGEFRGTLLGYLAKTLSSDLGGDAPYPGHEVRKIATSAEVRVLGYQISSKSSDLDDP
jgi:hypothetical protein